MEVKLLVEINIRDFELKKITVNLGSNLLNS
jgi:hypothetical protein